MDTTDHLDGSTTITTEFAILGCNIYTNGSKSYNNTNNQLHYAQLTKFGDQFHIQQILLLNNQYSHYHNN